MEPNEYIESTQARSALIPEALYNYASFSAVVLLSQAARQYGVPVLNTGNEETDRENLETANEGRDYLIGDLPGGQVADTRDLLDLPEATENFVFSTGARSLDLLLKSYDYSAFGTANTLYPVLQMFDLTIYELGKPENQDRNIERFNEAEQFIIEDAPAGQQEDTEEYIAEAPAELVSLAGDSEAPDTEAIVEQLESNETPDLGLEEMALPGSALTPSQEEIDALIAEMPEQPETRTDDAQALAETVVAYQNYTLDVTVEVLNGVNGLLPAPEEIAAFIDEIEALAQGGGTMPPPVDLGDTDFAGLAEYIVASEQAFIDRGLLVTNEQVDFTRSYVDSINAVLLETGEEYLAGQEIPSEVTDLLITEEASIPALADLMADMG